MTVAHEIRRPWPTRKPTKVRDGEPRWKLQLPFLTAFGYRYYFPALVTVWHVEPKGRDSGEVCKYYLRDPLPGPLRVRLSPFLKEHPRRDGAMGEILPGRGYVANRAWKWHVHHWHVQITSLQGLRARLFDRCAECGRKGRPNHSYMGASKSIGWRKWRSRENVWHSECMSLIHLRKQKDADEDLIRHLFAAYRLASDESEVDALERFTGSHAPDEAMSFPQKRRLWMLLGYERGDGYRLVKSERSNQSGGHPE